MKWQKDSQSLKSCKVLWDKRTTDHYKYQNTKVVIWFDETLYTDLCVKFSTLQGLGTPEKRTSILLF